MAIDHIGEIRRTNHWLRQLVERLALKERRMLARPVPTAEELRAVEILARIRPVTAAQVLSDLVSMTPLSPTATELRHARIRARGEDCWEVNGEEPSDRPPVLAPPDPKRLPMWRGPR